MSNDHLAGVPVAAVTRACFVNGCAGTLRPLSQR